MKKLERKWMYERLDANKKLRVEFVNGVKEFIEQAKEQESFRKYKKLRCPCKKCKNRVYLSETQVKKHLVLKGFRDRYYTWVHHGEDHHRTQIRDDRKALRNPRMEKPEKDTTVNPTDMYYNKLGEFDKKSIAQTGEHYFWRSDSSSSSSSNDDSHSPGIASRLFAQHAELLTYYAESQERMQCMENNLESLLKSLFGFSFDPNGNDENGTTCSVSRVSPNDTWWSNVDECYVQQSDTDSSSWESSSSSERYYSSSEDYSSGILARLLAQSAQVSTQSAALKERMQRLENLMNLLFGYNSFDSPKCNSDSDYSDSD